MKQFNKTYEAINHFRYYKPYEKDSTKSFWVEYDWSNWKMGDWVLIQYIKNGKEISKPIYGMFIEANIWDQALVIHIIEKPRAWKWHTDILTNPELNITMRMGELDPEVEAFELWTGNIHVLGHWKTKPTIGQLKESYKLNIK